jgi:hypothetical protein
VLELQFSHPGGKPGHSGIVQGSANESTRGEKNEAEEFHGAGAQHRPAGTIPLQTETTAVIHSHRMRFGRFYPMLACMLAILGLGSCGGPGSGNQSNFLVAPAPTPPNSSFPSPQLSGVVKLSADSFTNTESQHATEVEPSAASFGTTIVTAFQIGRIFSGGGAAIGFATSSDGGITWTRGVLPGLTVFQGGTYSAASDASVAYDAAHQVWLVSSLGVGNSDQVIVSRSADGVVWGNAITVSTSPSADKNWIVCDNTPSSPFFGHCYTEWDDPSNRGIIWMATSADGGLTWTSQNTAGSGAGVGGQPLVRPDGTVIVPIGDTGLAAVQVFSSRDGGASWTAPVTITPITDHIVAGGLRAGALVSAAIDAQGIIYVVWQDCRFRANCASNDVVVSTSSDGISWSAPARIPIDAVATTMDHFIPVIATESASGGARAKLAIIYYFYPVSACSTNCALTVGLISSRDGGSTWSAPTTLVGPMSLAWLPNTFSGSMVGDYFGATYSSGKLFTFFTIALPNMGTFLDEAIYGSQESASAVSVARFDSRFERAVPGAKSDHPARRFYDLENRYERPPRRKIP